MSNFQNSEEKKSGYEDDEDFGYDGAAGNRKKTSSRGYNPEQRSPHRFNEGGDPRKSNGYSDGIDSFTNGGSFANASRLKKEFNDFEAKQAVQDFEETKKIHEIVKKFCKTGC